MNQSFFVKCPKTFEDLQLPHTNENMSPFEIVKTISLSPLDYENFIYGLDVDRQYIEDNADLCSNGRLKKCLLIKAATRTDGILVVSNPEKPYLVLMAAKYQE